MVAQKERELNGKPTSAKKWTVRDAIADYLDWLAKHRKSAEHTRYTANAFILPELGNLLLVRLTKARIERWFSELAKHPARLRSRPGAPQRYRETSDDPEEAKRRRQSTVNRVLTILKAALNRAYHNGEVTSDDAWRRVKPFRGVDAARVRYLSDAEAQRLVNACWLC